LKFFSKFSSPDAEEKFGLIKEDAVDFSSKKTIKNACDEDLSVFEFK
jgi:hypothetical protein